MVAVHVGAWEMLAPNLTDCIEKVRLAKDTIHGSGRGAPAGGGGTRHWSLGAGKSSLAGVVPRGSRIEDPRWRRRHAAARRSCGRPCGAARPASCCCGRWESPDGDPPQSPISSTRHKICSAACLFVGNVGDEGRRAMLDAIDELVQAADLVDHGLLGGATYPAQFISTSAAALLVGSNGPAPFASFLAELVQAELVQEFVEPTFVDTMGSLSRIVAACMNLIKGLFKRLPPEEPPIRHVQICVRSLLWERCNYMYEDLGPPFPLYRESISALTEIHVRVYNSCIARGAESREAMEAMMHKEYLRVVGGVFSKLRHLLKENVSPSVAKVCSKCNMIEAGVHEGIPTAITATRRANRKLSKLMTALEDVLHGVHFMGLPYVMEQRTIELEQRRAALQP